MSSTGSYITARRQFMQDENSVLQLWSKQRRKEENQLVHSFGEETNSNDNNIDNNNNNNNNNNSICVYDSQHACKNIYNEEVL
jgi:hypothetical protein